MVDPISSIITLRGLLEKYGKGVKDRQAIAEITPILETINRIETEHFAIKEENSQLKVRNTQLQNELAALKAAKSEQDKDETKGVPDLNDVCIAILKYLAEAHSKIDEFRETNEISARINQSPIKTQRFLDELRKLGLIDWGQGRFELMYYYLTPEGLAYVVDNGLAT